MYKSTDMKNVDKMLLNKRGYVSSKKLYNYYRIGEEDKYLKDCKGNGDIIFEILFKGKEWAYDRDTAKCTEVLNPPIFKFNMTKKEIITYADWGNNSVSLIDYSLGKLYEEGYLDFRPSIYNIKWGGFMLYKPKKFVLSKPIKSILCNEEISEFLVPLPILKSDEKKYCTFNVLKQFIKKFCLHFNKYAQGVNYYYGMFEYESIGESYLKELLEFIKDNVPKFHFYLKGNVLLLNPTDDNIEKYTGQKEKQDKKEIKAETGLLG